MKKIHIIMIIGIIHGLIYVFIVPPWQHYDEPGHFEYVWLVANRLKLPHTGDYDQNMRLAVGQSLINSNFFGTGPLPNLTDPSKPIWIGIPQIIDPPLYYVIEAVPFFILRGTPVNVQLYAGRIVSLLFLAITIYSAYGLTKELTSSDHPVRWMAPLFIAMLPSFVEFMSSLNNFVAAIGIFSLWLFISVKLIRKFSFINTVFLVLLTIAGLLTQKILYPLLLYLPIVLILSIFPQKIKYLAWITVAIGAISSLLILLKWGDAAYWMRANDQVFSSQARIQLSGNSDSVLHGEVFPDTTWELEYPSWNSGFFQLIPSEVGDQLRGKTVTIGAWVWSDKKITGYGPGLNTLLQFQDNWLGFKQVSFNQNPRFIASVVQIPEQQDHLQIWLRTTSPDPQSASLYFSGVVMAEGTWPTDTPPTFTSRDGTIGTWGNKQFTNLVRNAQFQHDWPYLKPQIFQFLSNKVDGLKPFHISSFLSLFLDFHGTAWYTKAASNFIFYTFWAKFSWGQVPLLSNNYWIHPYRILFVFSLLGIAGALIASFKLARSHKNEYLFLLLITMMTVVIAYLYGVYTMGGALRYRPYIPTARYIFPAITSIALFLAIGWQGAIAWGTKALKMSFPLFTYAYTGFFLVLDFYSLASVIVFFRGT